VIVIVINIKIRKIFSSVYNNCFYKINGSICIKCDAKEIVTYNIIPKQLLFVHLLDGKRMLTFNKYMEITELFNQVSFLRCIGKFIKNSIHK